MEPDSKDPKTNDNKNNGTPSTTPKEPKSNGDDSDSDDDKETRLKSTILTINRNGEDNRIKGMDLGKIRSKLNNTITPRRGN